VRAVLFNVFGGITRCDEVARGVLTALDRLDVSIPIVVRLDGTHDVEGRKILADAAPANLVVAETMLGAAEQVVELAGAA
jgi:succinyl-CoA synthetase beta subunit